MGKFVKGQSGNPRGRPPGKGPGPIVMYDLKQAMRALCPEAAKVVKRCLKSEDEKIALLAAQIAFERGFGRPELRADVDVNYRFVIAPQTMGLDEWLACKGQPAPNRWLERQAQPKASTQAQDTKATLVERANDTTSEYSEASTTRPELSGQASTSVQPDSKTGNEADNSSMEFAEHEPIERSTLN